MEVKGVRNERRKENLFENNNTWIMTVAGCGESQTLSYRLYIGFVTCVLLYGLSMSIWAAVIVMPDKILVVLAFHFTLVVTYGLGVLASRLFTRRSLKETNNMIKSGIYVYDEQIDETQSNMKTELAKEVKKTCDMCALVFGSGSVSNLVLFPLLQLMVAEDTDKDSLLNPYLPPFLFYVPFNTRTPGGYCLAYFIFAVIAAFLYCNVISFLIIYARCTVSFRGELEILNYSLKHIHQRALSKYKKMKLQNGDASRQLSEKDDFQACLVSCFKANVKHHQAILRFKACLQPFNGACLLECYALIAIIYAVVLYIILQDLPVGYLINFLLMLFSEQCGLFVMCYLGENVTDESGRVFETLYDIDWYDYSKQVSKGLGIMMSNTLQPLYVKALLLDSSAALVSYGDFMMGMYKIMNLMRQSDAAA